MKKSMLILLMVIGVSFGLKNFTAEPLVEARNETVILLHGLVRSSKAMSKLEKQLKAEGYEVINLDYPSTSAPIEELTDGVFQSLETKITDPDTIHFVTHSMGGLILRDYLEDHELPNLGRVVMLAPPSRGSEVTDKLGNVFLYKWINGPAGDQLGTGINSHPLRLKAPEFELGIIAGDRSINPILSLLIPGEDDGKVAVSRVKPEAYTDYLQLHTTHATMMWNRTVLEQTIHFLEAGRFERSSRNNLHINNAYFAACGKFPMR